MAGKGLWLSRTSELAPEPAGFTTRLSRKVLEVFKPLHAQTSLRFGVPAEVQQIVREKNDSRVGRKLTMFGHGWAGCAAVAGRRGFRVREGAVPCSELRTCELLELREVSRAFEGLGPGHPLRAARSTKV